MVCVRKKRKNEKKIKTGWFRSTFEGSSSPMRPFGGRSAPVVFPETTFTGLQLHIASSAAR